MGTRCDQRKLFQRFHPNSLLRIERGGERKSEVTNLPDPTRVSTTAYAVPHRSVFHFDVARRKSVKPKSQRVPHGFVDVATRMDGNRETLRQRKSREVCSQAGDWNRWITLEWIRVRHRKICDFRQSFKTSVVKIHSSEFLTVYQEPVNFFIQMSFQR